MTFETHDFQAAMRAAGLDFPGELIPDGRLHRIKVNGDHDPNSWYVLHIDGLPAGAFGCNKRMNGEIIKWCAKADNILTEAERAERNTKWKQQQAERDAEWKRQHDEARAKAQAILDAATTATNDHPYLKRKGVKAYPGVLAGPWPQRRRENCLLIPLRTAGGQLATVQAIFPDPPATGRDKDFLKGGAKKGAYFALGDLAAAPVIVIAEGYATAATLHEATGYAAVMAVDAGNIRPVADALRAVYPDRRIIIAADNDRHTESNPGLAKATAAANALKVRMAIPEFADDEPGTDFNDLAQLRGLEGVKTAIENAIQENLRFVSRVKEINNKPSQPSCSSQSIIYNVPNLHKPSLTFTTDVPLLEGVDENGQTTLIESEAAAKLATRLKGHFAYAGDVQTWYCFAGTYWQALSPHVINELVTAMLYAGAPSGFKARHVTAMTSLLAHGQLSLPLAPDRYLLPFENGLFDVATRTLTPATPETALTWCLPYAYDPAADCPTIKAWLRQTVGNDQKLAEFLRAWLAALLTGRADLQKFLHLLGFPGTGKGAFIRLATALVGSHNAATTDLRSLETNRFETAVLYGKRLAVISDSSKYGGTVDVLKAATGQDWLRLERKYQQQGATFMFGGLVLIASNEPLITADYTSALERRRLTLRFDRIPTDDERQFWDEQGGETAVLHREIPGLVNWCLALTRDDVTRAILNPPASLLENNQEALRYGNAVAGWLMDNVIPQSDAKTKVGDKQVVVIAGRTHFENADRWLYPNFLDWCQRANLHPLSHVRFSAMVVDLAQSLKVPVRKIREGTGIKIIGLRLRNPEEWAYVWTHAARNEEVF